MAKNCFLSSNSATSAPVECLFSIAGKVFRPERCSLKDDTFEKLNMMIKCIHQIKYVLKRVSFGSKDCTKELKLECAYFLGQTS